jgi:hypothetical protein
LSFCVFDSFYLSCPFFFVVFTWWLVFTLIHVVPPPIPIPLLELVLLFFFTLLSPSPLSFSFSFSGRSCCLTHCFLFVLSPSPPFPLFSLLPLTPPWLSYTFDFVPTFLFSCPSVRVSPCLFLLWRACMYIEEGNKHSVVMKTKGPNYSRKVTFGAWGGI